MPSTRKKPEPPEEAGAPAWMNTYGDMVTLLLTFFVLLFSFSTIDAKKWKAIVEAFSGKTDYDGPTATLSPDFDFDDVVFPDQTPEPSVSPDEGARMAERFNELYQKVRNHIIINGLELALNVTKDDDLIIIRVTDTALFDSGREDIRPDALSLLDSIVSIFEEYDDAIQRIQIEGHTDNVPIHSVRFKSNWELSTSRAVSVVQYCIENSSLSPMKYTASGYGEYHPIAENDTEEGKAKNRRVDFVIQSMEDIEIPDNIS
ncbi:MAG TPA: flagellar motor protein MotB [Feifaniaceae bacterium]|nr:flagellar motor protein MotB [Feifaniaceae bacterium]